MKLKHLQMCRWTGHMQWIRVLKLDWDVSLKGKLSQAVLCGIRLQICRYTREYAEQYNDNYKSLKAVSFNGKGIQYIRLLLNCLVDRHTLKVVLHGRVTQVPLQQLCQLPSASSSCRSGGSIGCNHLPPSCHSSGSVGCCHLRPTCRSVRCYYLPPLVDKVLSRYFP
jgi:hypothetical protein